ncbi:hypothetical protein H920_19406 [Fukomys damarensis]|uniref:EF-hand domain-containing protein n=1 Tax=Fukomys damarensis TaxID=885580 RepID=A0A091CMT0_FUKDA|nr:hypothetical protein H920_19406 [Fukomys damarensis]
MMTGIKPVSSRNDLLMVCRQLNMEESVAEIMDQLGADENGKISFQDFTRCHMQLVQEIRKEEVDLSVKSDNSWKKKKLRDRIASWPTSSDNSLGALSAARESWEYDSGARDLQSPDLQTQSGLQKLLEYAGRPLHQQAALHKLLIQSPRFGNSVGGRYLELANTVALDCCTSSNPFCRADVQPDTLVQMSSRENIDKLLYSLSPLAYLGLSWSPQPP